MLRFTGWMQAFDYFGSASTVCFLPRVCCWVLFGLANHKMDSQKDNNKT